jgi:SHS2 domain-containing protein
MSAHWEHFPHEADMGVRGVGATKAQAFEQAALALTAVVTDPQTIEPRQPIEVECEAPDDELLLADWLNTLIFEMSAHKMLFSRFAVRLDGQRLRARAWGESIDRARHQPAVEIKGATYTALRVAQENGEWVAQTVVDV